MRLTYNRYHIGESLIPSVRHYLRFIGAEDKLANHGFVPKVGGYPKLRENAVCNVVNVARLRYQIQSVQT